MTIPFTKMHGIGNDFVMVDLIRDHGLSSSQPWPKISQFACDRRFGIGGDGLILLDRQDSTLQMRMFNPDGSESEMCGNGIRCFGLLAHDRGYVTEDHFPVLTGAGTLELELLPEHSVTVNMGRARLSPTEIGMAGTTEAEFINQELGFEGLRGTAVSMGNPHLVIFVKDASAVPLEEWGPKLETHPSFPNRVNVHFIEVVDRGHLVQRTWERGAGITLACGTGACASGVAAHVNGLADRKVAIKLPGGSLGVDYRPDGTVFMTGPAETVFDGQFDVPQS